MKKISILIVTAALFACSCSNKEEKKEEPKQEVSEMQALVRCLSNKPPLQSYAC